MKKSVVVLRLASLSIPKKIEKTRFIVTSMTGNVNFTTPNPTLATITANAGNLETAHIAAQGGGADETANMHAKELVLDLSLKLLSAYVEGIANSNPMNAEAIILSAGMEVKSGGGRRAKEFAAEQTGNPGEVKLSTLSSNRATFVFQMTTSPSTESSWATIGQSTRAKLVKSGLVSGTRYYFRVAMIDKNGQNPWSDVKNIIAL
ncbi:MAG: fibronectin type III domain-containing protein [Bacteroidetes bacterium]|nr:fibronectin type III domain-containing protein [Bacteroidota bacterium]